MAQPTQAQWVPCPSGELERLAQHLQKRRQRRWFLRTAGGAAAAAAGGALAWWLGRELFSQPSRKAFTCEEVLARAEDYIQGVLSEDEQEQIRAHLAQCPPCWREYESKGLV